MVRKIMLLAFLVYNLIAWDTYAVSYGNMPTDNYFYSEIEHASSAFDQEIFSENKENEAQYSHMLLGDAGTKCPVCGLNTVVNGKCTNYDEDCTYESGTGIGTEVPIGDALWILPLMAGIYAFHKRRKSRKEQTL